MAFQTLDDLLKEGVESRHVLVRSDFNVPLDEEGNITDPGRINASLPTIKALVDGGAKVILSAHLGRPKGEVNSKYSLAPVAEALSEALGQYVALANDVTGEDAHERANGLNSGDVMLVENVRFDPRETSKDEAERGEFADELVALAADNGAFVSDGFGVVHRKQASVFDVAKLLPAYAGGLVDAEVRVLAQLTENPSRPYAVVLGGSKVSDKLGVIRALAPKVDTLVIGGGMAFTFLAAQGYSVGTSLLQEDQIEICKQLLEEFEVTHEELASRLGRSRPVITNMIRLLKLPIPVQRRVAAGVLSAGHARALLSLETGSDAQEALAARIVAEGLSVRATEEIVAIGEDKKPRRTATPREPNPALDDLASNLSDKLDTRVGITMGKNKGKLTVEFASVDDLNRIMDALGIERG